MKKLMVAAIVLALFAAGYLYMSTDNASNRTASYRTAPVQRGDLKITVAATGTVTPFVEVEVKSKAGGEIVSFPFQEGDLLNKGDVAVRLDPETERSRVKQASADLLVAEANLEKSRITLQDQELRLKRQKSLFEDKVISRQDLDNAVLEVSRAQSDVKIAEAGLIRARETLKEARDRLDDTEIRAPLSGTILKKQVEEGQVIASTTSSVSEGTLLFTMADLNRIYIEAMVDETDVGRVRSGQQVTIGVDAYPGKTFSGKVVRIAPKGRVESTITVFDVTIEVQDQEKQKLRPMMTANAEILLEREAGVLLVPSEAVRMRDNETGIYRLVEGKPLWSQITRGMSNGIQTEISGDVQEGDTVITSGLTENRAKNNRADNMRRGFWFFGRKK